jgi:hypothetical protein
MCQGGAVEGVVMAEQSHILGEFLSQRGRVFHGMICFQHDAVGMQVSQKVTEEISRSLQSGI